MSARFLARLTSPRGEVSYICHKAPGLTPDPADALAFVSEEVAARAGRNAIHGDPAAFWNSERANAEATRQRMRGWTHDTTPAPAA